MENKLMIFENEAFGKVRTLNLNGEPWFVAVDVCSVLDLSNPTIAVSRLDEDERAKFNLGRQGDATIVNEPGLYTLVLGSRKPEAKAFKRWITHEVIPAIRKHGAYMTDALLTRMDEHPELISEYIGKLRAENAKANAAQEALKKAEAENARLAPKASYYDSFVGVESVTCLRYTAKELGVPQKKFIGYLLEKGYVFRDRHRSDRVFVRAGKRNDPLFVTRDFYLPNGTKSEYTLVTPAGKAHFLKIAEKIRVWEPREVAEGKDASEQAVFAACA